MYTLFRALDERLQSLFPEETTALLSEICGPALALPGTEPQSNTTVSCGTVHARLRFKPYLARLLNVLAFLLAGVQSFF